MSINNQLEELVDEAVPPGGTIDCENLHELLHVIVVNLADLNNINMDYKCSAESKTTNAIEKNQQNVNQIKDQVKDLASMSEKQKRMLTEVELKVKSLEEELNKVSKPGQPRAGRRSRSHSRTRVVSRSNSKKSLKTHSCIEPKRSQEWTTWNHPGKAGSSKQTKISKMAINPKQSAPDSVSNIQIPELKKWIESKLRSFPASDDLTQRIDQLVKEKMHSTVIPDLKKMIENMISQVSKDQKGTQGKGSVPLCLSCQKAGGNRTQVSSQDCLCVIKRKLKNASKNSKMNVQKR